MACLCSFRKSFGPKPCGPATDNSAPNLLLDTFFYNISNCALSDYTAQRLVETSSTGDTTKHAAQRDHIKVVAAIGLRLLGHQFCFFFRYASLAGTGIHSVTNAAFYRTDTRSDTKPCSGRYTSTRRSGSDKRNCAPCNFRQSINRIDRKRTGRSLNFFPYAFAFSFPLDSRCGLGVLTRLRRSQAFCILRYLFKEVRRRVVGTEQIGKSLSCTSQAGSDIERNVRCTRKYAPDNRDFLKEVFLFPRAFWATASLLLYVGKDFARASCFSSADIVDTPIILDRINPVGHYLPHCTGREPTILIPLVSPTAPPVSSAPGRAIPPWPPPRSPSLRISLNKATSLKLG